MGVREGSKKIVQYFLNKAIESGNLGRCFSCRHSDLTKALQFESMNYCYVCLQYLEESGLAGLEQDDEVSETSGVSIHLSVKSVDFAEST